MERSFKETVELRSMNHRARRLNRAKWWFRRMRGIVDRAIDWQPMPQGRPEQVYFTLPSRR
jgi:hypothetical protein